MQKQREKIAPAKNLNGVFFSSDKAAIIFKNEDLRERYQFKSRNKAKSEVKYLEQLRNALAHGQFLDLDDLGEGINIIIARLNSVMMQQRLKSNDLASTLVISDPDMLKKLRGLEKFE